jgi:hypothetical protein
MLISAHPLCSLSSLSIKFFIFDSHSLNPLRHLGTLNFRCLSYKLILHQLMLVPKVQHISIECLFSCFSCFNIRTNHYTENCKD